MRTRIPALSCTPEKKSGTWLTELIQHTHSQRKQLETPLHSKVGRSNPNRQRCHGDRQTKVGSESVIDLAYIWRQPCWACFQVRASEQAGSSTGCGPTSCVRRSIKRKNGPKHSPLVGSDREQDDGPAVLLFGTNQVHVNVGLPPTFVHV